MPAAVLLGPRAAHQTGREDWWELHPVQDYWELPFNPGLKPSCGSASPASLRHPYSALSEALAVEVHSGYAGAWNEEQAGFGVGVI